MGKGYGDEAEGTPVCKLDSNPHALAANGLPDVLAKLLETSEAAIDLNAKDEYNCAPLLWAARNGHIDMLKLLLDKGADVETAGYNGMRALHHVCNSSKEGLVALLLEHDANANAADESGATPLHWAAARGVLNIVVRLSDKGADPNVATKTGVRPIHKACMYGQAQIVKKLVEGGADLDAADESGNTALHYAARMGFAECVRALVGLNANRKAQNKTKQLPADVALTPEIEDLL